MRKTEIIIHDTTARWLTEDEHGYHYEYDTTYPQKAQPEAISVKLPVQILPFTNTILFPFFDGLIPES